jgi:hypothetical protein
VGAAVPAQGGLVVLPHFPNPRAEHAASIVSGDIDAVEMTSWGDLYSGIDPYSLSDWYRYLNCGYLVPAVGGTDKMWPGTAGGHGAHLRPPAAGRAFHLRGLDGGRAARRDVCDLRPAARFCRGRQPMGSRIAMPPAAARWT